jgi:hypothetical protein
VSEQLLSLLRAAPVGLAKLSDGVPEQRLHTAPEGEWSVRDVLAHLRSCADVWGDCMARLLVEDRPTIRAVSPRTWIDQTDYLAQPFLPSLQAFSRQRAELLALLEPLGPEQWARTATVTGAGRPYERTVLTYAERLATHERGHLKQVAGLLG